MRRLFLVLLFGVGAAAWWLLGGAGGPEPARPAAAGAAGPQATGPLGTPLGEPPGRPDPLPVPAAPRSVLPAEAQPAPAAPLRARLIDRRSAEPLASYQVHLRQGSGPGVRLMTDAQGELASSGPLPAGPLTLRLVDVEGQESANSSQLTFVRLEHAPAGDRLDVPIEVGPTYALELDLPEDTSAADLRAYLSLDPPASPADSGARAITTVLRTRKDRAPRHWVRFRRGLDGAPAWLGLETLDRRWSGGVRVASGRGNHAEPVRVVLEARCSVVGRFQSSAQPHERGGGVLALFAASSPPQEEPLAWAYCDGQGAFRIAGLEPGEYRLEVRDEAVRATPLTFVLARGELDLGRLDWQPIPLAGRVRVRLRSARDVALDLQLVRTFDRPRHAAWHSDRWRALPEGGFESAFEWDEVYAGEYELEVHAHDDVAWHLALGRLEPPVEDLLLELPVPRPALAFEVTRSEDGSRVDDWFLWVRGREGWDSLGMARSALESFAYDTETRFALAAPGRRAWLGAPPAADGPGGVEGPVAVRLEPGWSRLFLARLRSTGQPVAGAEIWLDGSLAGRTDAKGELWVHRALAPLQHEVRHPTLLWAGPHPADLTELVSPVLLRPL